MADAHSLQNAAERRARPAEYGEAPVVEPYEALPGPAGWEEPRSRFQITSWSADRSTTDTTAVRLAERDGEPFTLVGFSVGMWLADTVGVLAFGAVATWWIAGDLVEMWARATPLGTAVMLAVLAIMTIPLIGAMIRLIAGRGELALSRNGVRLRSAASWTYLPWSAARDVKAELKYYDNHGRRFIMIACDSPESLRTGGLPRPFRWRSALRIDVAYIAINRVLLYHLLRFYYRHPQARDELGTLASIDRIHRRDFPSPRVRRSDTQA
jgi:hypothetical protein